jgi:hypothetical protein
MESRCEINCCYGDWVSYVTRSAHSAFDFFNRCKHRYFSPSLFTALSDAKLSQISFRSNAVKIALFDPTHELSNNAIRFEGSFLDMNTAESSTNLIAMPGLAQHRDNVTSLFQQPRRLLDVCDVAKWLSVSNGWVRDHASGRRQPKLQAIKLGSRKGKGLWKFREEEVQQFLCDRNFR